MSPYATLHAVAALISWSKRVEYRVVRRHDSRLMANVYVLIEIRAGVERELFQSTYISEVYWMRWQLVNPEWDVDAMLASAKADIEAGVA